MSAIDISIIAICISFIALIFSAIALSITFRKEAHRIQLEITQGEYSNVVLGIKNDSGIDTLVRSIGYFMWFGDVIWISGPIGNYQTNKSTEFPFTVIGRSTFEAYLNSANFKSGRKSPDLNKVGICVQLDTGRIYVLSQQVNLQDSIRMHLVSWISRLSGGRYAPGIQRPRIKAHN